MRAILLEKDQLIADAWDAKWTEGSAFVSDKLEEPHLFGISFKCDSGFLKSFFNDDGSGKRINCLYIGEDLSHKYLYGLQPKSVAHGESYCEIDFSVDYFYFISEDNADADSDYHKMEKKWLKHSRNRRIDEILGQ